MSSLARGAQEQCTAEECLPKIVLQSFQRCLVWNNRKAEDLLCSLLNSKPVGTLLLFGYEKEKSLFKPRGIRSEFEPDTHSCEHLILNGQQRLTALCRTLNVDHQKKEKNCYFRLFAKIKDKDVAKFETVEEVVAIRQIEQFEETDFLRTWQEKNLIPIGILWLRGNRNISTWCGKVCRNDAGESRAFAKSFASL